MFAKGWTSLCKEENYQINENSKLRFIDSVFEQLWALFVNILCSTIDSVGGLVLVVVDYMGHKNQFLCCAVLAGCHGNNPLSTKFVF